MSSKAGKGKSSKAARSAHPLMRAPAMPGPQSWFCGRYNCLVQHRSRDASLKCQARGTIDTISPLAYGEPWPLATASRAEARLLVDKQRAARQAAHDAKRSAIASQALAQTAQLRLPALQQSSESAAQAPTHRRGSEASTARAALAGTQAHRLAAEHDTASWTPAQAPAKQTPWIIGSAIDQDETGDLRAELTQTNDLGFATQPTEPDCFRIFANALNEVFGA